VNLAKAMDRSLKRKRDPAYQAYLRSFELPESLRQASTYPSKPTCHCHCCCCQGKETQA
jgi:hypothetical protein